MSKNNSPLIILVLAVAGVALLCLMPTPANAGTISYVKITGDADCGINTENTYTHTLDFGTGTPGALINGVQFDAYNLAANGTLNFNDTVNSGTLTEHAGNANFTVSGGLVDLLTDMYYDNGNVVGGTRTWTLSGLTPGKSYETRIYARQWGANNQRTVIFAFDPDGTGPISDVTETINQDDATTVGMPNDNDAYYINYEFTAVAGEDLVITLTQDLLNQSWHLYGITNQEYSPGIATVPYPADGATDVWRDADLSWTPGASAVTHDVYVGESFEEVEAATVPTASGLDVPSFDPGRLELGTTYFWRVDEVNGAPDYTVFKGDIWSFTVEPAGYPISDITATVVGNPDAETGLENIINGAGLNENDEHSVDSDDMWSASLSEPLQVQFAFGQVYALYQMQVWNYNVELENMLGFGAKDVTIEYSIDGTEWTLLDEVELAQAPGAETCTAGTLVDFDNAQAQYVRLTINSAWGVYGSVGLSEVRLMYNPLSARLPDPASGATGVAPDATLSWRAGRQADQHNVYLATDEQAVIDGTASMETVSESSYDAALDLNQTYYWRVDEVNDLEDPAVWTGDVWTVSTTESILIEAFEDFDDDENRIYFTWIDGWDNGTGATVGYFETPFTETTLAYSGGQSMPLTYENANGTTISQTDRTFEGSQDWSAYGIKSLSLYFFGDPANTTGQLFVKINGTKVTYDGDASDLQSAAWMPWVIDLTGLNVQSVKTLSIGVEGSGASGLVLIDDIRVYPYEGTLIESVEPSDEGLVAYYPLDGDATDVVGGHDGTITGTPDFVAGVEGQAIDIAANAGVAQEIIVAYAEDLALNSFTVAAWINVKDLDSARGILGTRFISDNTFDLKVEDTRVHGDIGDGSAWLNTSVDITAAHGGVVSLGDWHHVAYAIDAEAGAADLYLDGVFSATITFSGTPLLMKSDQELHIGNSSSAEYMSGMIDEVRIYNRALSAGEMAGLVGRPGPFYLPF